MQNMRKINFINLNNSIDNILKKRLIKTEKQRLIYKLLFRQGFSRQQCIKATDKILWIHRHKARA